MATVEKSVDERLGKVYLGFLEELGTVLKDAPKDTTSLEDFLKTIDSAEAATKRFAASLDEVDSEFKKELDPIFEEGRFFKGMRALAAKDLEAARVEIEIMVENMDIFYQKLQYLGSVLKSE